MHKFKTPLYIKNEIFVFDINLSCLDYKYIIPILLTNERSILKLKKVEETKLMTES